MSDTELIHFFHDGFAPHLIGELVQVTLTEDKAHKTAPRTATWVGTLEAYAHSEEGVSFALRGRERNVHIPEGEAGIQIVSYSRPPQIYSPRIELGTESLNAISWAIANHGPNRKNGATA